MLGNCCRSMRKNFFNLPLKTGGPGYLIKCNILKVGIMVELENNKGTLDTVQVALRIRPLMQKEIERGCEECIEVVPGEQQVQIKDLAFTYNYVFPQHITQHDFYDTAVKGLIGKLFQGF